MGLNKQCIIGNLGKDPEVRTYPDGSKAGRFPVAVTENAYTAQNGQQIPEHTEWFNVLVRGKKAEIAELYLHKGDKVYVEGKTFTGEYQDQSGQTKRYTEVRCDVLELLTPKSQSQYQPAPQQGNVQQPAPQYAPAPAAPQYAQGQAPQYGQAPTQQYAPAPQAAVAAPAPQVGVYGQPAQAVPVEQKPCP